MRVGSIPTLRTVTMVQRFRTLGCVPSGEGSIPSGHPASFVQRTGRQATNLVMGVRVPHEVRQGGATDVPDRSVLRCCVPNAPHNPVAQLGVQRALNPCGCGFESHLDYSSSGRLLVVDTRFSPERSGFNPLSEYWQRSGAAYALIAHLVRAPA